MEDRVGEVVLCDEFASSAVEVQLPGKAVVFGDQDLVKRTLCFAVLKCREQGVIEDRVLQFLGESLDAVRQLLFVAVLIWSVVRMKFQSKA